MSKDCLVTFSPRFDLLSKAFVEKDRSHDDRPFLMPAPPRILIAGCGYLGRSLGEIWQQHGLSVLGVTRSPESAETLRKTGWEARALDIANVAECLALADQMQDIDMIVHCAASGRGGGETEYAAVYLDGTAHLQRAFPAARLFFTSSTSVYPQVDGAEITELCPAQPHRGTGKILRRAEDGVLAAGGTVLRLAGIYGPDRSVLLRNFLNGSATIDVRHAPPQSPDGRWINQIHRTDAIAAIRHLQTLPPSVTAGEIFNVTDSQPLTQREVYEFLAMQFSRPLPPESHPDETRKRGWTNKRISNAKLRTTGWSPCFPSYFAALENDPALIPSILAQLESGGT